METKDFIEFVNRRMLQLLEPDLFEPIDALIATLENLRTETELEFLHAR